MRVWTVTSGGEDGARFHPVGGSGSDIARETSAGFLTYTDVLVRAVLPLLTSSCSAEPGAELLALLAGMPALTLIVCKRAFAVDEVDADFDALAAFVGWMVSCAWVSDRGSWERWRWTLGSR